jgi:hypothetical protein
MPRDGAIIFGDLSGKLRDATLVDWLVAADCPKKSARNWSDQCAARCLDLAVVL